MTLPTSAQIVASLQSALAEQDASGEGVAETLLGPREVATGQTGPRLTATTASNAAASHPNGRSDVDASELGHVLSGNGVAVQPELW